MRVIPVLDLRGGRAVQARPGPRASYPLVRSRLAPGEGDALALARAYRDALGCDECYVADLDAIAGGAPQGELLGSLARLGGRLLVDPGTTTPDGALATLAAGATRVVIGLETLDSFGALAEIVSAVGVACVVFSLDLRLGASPAGAPLTLVDQTVRAGVGALIALDLARVGTAAGMDLELVGAIRHRHPDLELLAGGGAGGVSDLARAAEVGCDGVLVAAALHDGRLTAADLDVVRGRGAGAPRRGGHVNDSR
ncbi:MAG: HisA/HisF-related TIM barrel protein [Gemmatimonadales bacterium]